MEMGKLVRGLLCVCSFYYVRCCKIFDVRVYICIVDESVLYIFTGSVHTITTAASSYFLYLVVIWFYSICICYYEMGKYFSEYIYGIDGTLKPMQCLNERNSLYWWWRIQRILYRHMNDENRDCISVIWI